MGLTPRSGLDPLVGRRPPDGHWVIISIGILALSVLYVIGACVLKSYAASFFAAPIFVGAVVGLLSLRQPFTNAWITLVASLLLAVLTLREGVVCMLLSVPLVGPFVMLGAACGWTVRRFARARRHQYFLAVLIFAAGAGWQVVEGSFDRPSRHPVHLATSAVEVAAAPDEVWRALTERPIEVRSSWPWFLRIGLPMPWRMELVDAGPQGRLRMDFSQGVARGHVITWQPGHALAFAVDRYEIHDAPFHITRLGRGPHWGMKPERVEDWLTFIELRYTLEPTASGGTRLERQTVWRRHLAPAFYFGWLQQQIIAHGQARLLDLVRERVLEDRAAAPPIARR
jgi:uncharacterized protein YndB with AHSA1/START domain